MKDVDDTISDDELLLELHPRVSIAQVRRLRKSMSVRLRFNTEVTP